MLVLHRKHLFSVCDSIQLLLLLLINLFTVHCDFASIVIGSSDVHSLPHYDTEDLNNATFLQCVCRSWTGTEELQKKLRSSAVDWDNLWRIDNFDEEEERYMDEVRQLMSREIVLNTGLVDPWDYLKSIFPDDPTHRMYKFHKLLNRTDEERTKIGPAYSYRMFRSRWKRLTYIRKCTYKVDGVVYWISRELRIQDNWAMIFAQKLAVSLKVPLHVVYYARQKFEQYNVRHWGFIIQNLQDIEDELSKLNIRLHLIYGNGEERLQQFIKKYQIGAVVLDFSPLRGPVKWAQMLSKELNNTVPIYQVDAHNIIPIWRQKEFMNPNTGRTLSTYKLGYPYFLTMFPKVVRHPYASTEHYEKIFWNHTYRYYGTSEENYTAEAEQLNYPPPGYIGAWMTFFFFIDRRIKRYLLQRNNPNLNVLSNLSPYLNFGSISRQRVMLIMQGSHFHVHNKTLIDSVRMHNIFIIPEVADSYCLFNPNYDRFTGGSFWGQHTLNEHRNDPRPHIYTLEELETYQTTDDLWNSCQKVLVASGKLHTLLRKFWAKRLLLWTRTPEEAFDRCIYLNNKYSLDGNDPQSYFGCKTALTSDLRRSSETPIYGLVKHPNVTQLMKLFDIPYFIRTVLGMEAYKRSLKKYSYKKENVSRKHYNLILQNKDTDEREALTTDEKISYPDYMAKAEEWERVAREKRAMRKKHSNCTTL